MPRKFALLLVFAAFGAAAQNQQDEGPAFFEKNIRPILVQQCLGCHSATSQPIMGGLRLDDRAFALKGGSRGPAIVPGNPAESLLLKVLLHTAGPLKMPPGPKMKPAEAALFAQWIGMGAPWGNNAAAAKVTVPEKKYWAFVPPQAPAIPKVQQTNWVRNPIDAFILAALEAKSLSPAPSADKRTLLRRATYDLTGLPPSPEEVRSFLSDSSPEAFTKVVDRLLASPRYGERWARHWLDVARYADSNGLDENLVYKNAFRYRDYVISAFNQDKPYTQFLTEQIAGDLLLESNDQKTQYERWTATGFLSLGAKMLAEDDPVKMEMDIVDEQLDTTMRAFSGLTVGCARCHDHKFDPIPHADYYAMAGIFKSSKTMENFKVVAKWHEYVLAPKADRDRLAAHEARIEEKRKEIGKLTKGENDRLGRAGMDRMGAYLLASAEAQRDAAIRIAPLEKESGAAIVKMAGMFDAGNAPRILEKKRPNINKDVKGPYFAEYVVHVPESGVYQMDIFDEEKGSGTADLWLNGEWVKQGEPPVENREASPEAGGWTYVAMLELRKGANTIRLEHASRFPYFQKFLLAKNTLPHAPQTRVQIARRFGVNPGFLGNVVDYLERSNGAAASVLYAWETLGMESARRSDWASPVAALFTTEKTADQIAARYGTLFQEAERAGKEVKDPGLKALYDFLHEKFGPFRAPANARRYYTAEIQSQLRTLDQEVKDMAAATPEFPKAMGVAESGAGADLAIHLRGSHWSLGDKVPRGFLRALGNTSVVAPSGKESGRLQLAQWLADPQHPLTSRVMVNRIWRWRFGRGIVPSVDNFGRLGEKPSNQALLDWLAVQFVDKGWSMKQMHRLMMLSNTYQMSSTYDAKSYEGDPENILLWRFPRRRLEVEAVRDAIMTASGSLDHSAAGGTILKYKDRQYVANTSKGGDVDYDKPVRAVYIPVVRSSLYDVFRAFDLPDPATSNGDRDSTVVAPQALFMMNSSVMLQQSKRMAEHLLHAGGSDDVSRIRAAYETSLSRPPTPQEIDQAQTFLARMEQEWKGDKVRAWQSFCKSLLSSSEFIYLN